MAIKPFNTLIGDNYGIRMAPDLDWWDTRTTGAPYILTGSIDVSGSLQTVLSLTGKFQINLVYITGMTTDDMDQFKLTVDGIVIHNEDTILDNVTQIFVIGNFAQDSGPQPFQCNESFLLEMEMVSDADINLYVVARPIL